MRKMTPMILVILMLASVLSSIDVYELQNENNYEETSSRAEADAELVSITEPRETTTDSLDNKVNTLLAERPVDFKVFIRNSGDADLFDLGYQVNIYDVDDSGIPTTLAKDSNGNDLSWQNNQVICPTGCQSTGVAPGDFLTGGEATLVDASNATIKWTPTAGDYYVEIRISSAYGSDTNNVQSIQVSAVEYMDIDLSMTWLDGNMEPQQGAMTGTEDKYFEVSLTYDNPSNPLANIRNATVEIVVEGDATLNSADRFVKIGVSTTVDVQEDSSGQSDTGVRLIMGSDGEDGGQYYETAKSNPIMINPEANGDYTVTAILHQFTVYDSNDCEVGIAVCEKLIEDGYLGDEFQFNNQDTIGGAASTFDDISLEEFYLAKYSTDLDTGDDIIDPFMMNGEKISETLSPGDYLVVSRVDNTASNMDRVYDWDMTFTLTDLMGDSEPQTTNGDACPDLPSSFNYATHAYLGDSERLSGDDMGYVCHFIELGTGAFEYEARLNMLGLVEGDDNAPTLDEKTTDMNLANNVRTVTFDVMNFAPVVISAVGPKDAVPIGSEMEFNVNVFDVEDEQLTYTWSSGGLKVDCGDSPTCKLVATSDMVPSYSVFVNASDPHGGYVNVEITSAVMNVGTFTSTDLDNGLEVSYTIEYKSSGLDVQFDNTDVESLQIDGCVGTYNPVASFVVNPNLNFPDDKLGSQTLDIEFPGSLEVAQYWIEYSGVFTLGSANDPLSDGPVMQKYTYDFPSNSMINAGTIFHLLGNDCVIPEVPSTQVNSVVANARIAGGIGIEWSAPLADGESVKITVCEGQTGCETPIFEADYQEDVNSANLAGSNTNHNGVYAIEAKICNEVGCGTSKTATATADKQVDDISAANIAVEAVGETWVLTWTTAGADADSNDLKGWYVCYQKSSFDAERASQLIADGACEETENNNITINQYTSAGVYTVHFAVMPYDHLLNVAATASDTTIDYNREVDVSNPDDGSTTTESETSSDVPTWTWGVIGAVVVVAFVVGAFILSRGDGEEGDDKEYDY